MNRLHGKIEEIQVSGHLSLVTVSLGSGLQLRAIVIDTPQTASYLAAGGRIGVLFKETEAILSLTDGAQTSVDNWLTARVESLEEGELLSRVALRSEDGPITAVAARGSVRRLGLKAGKEVYVLIPLNEIMLTEL